MPAVADRPVDGLLVVAAAHEAPCVQAAAGGEAVVLSTPSPDREGPNQDAAAILPCGPGRAVLAVADGVGGHAAGSRASTAAVEALRDAVADALSRDGSLRDGILDGFERANAAIRAQGVGAATTLVVAELEDGLLRPYHAGDSQLVLVGQRGRIKHQTVPHSPVGQAVDAGFLDEREALVHDERHVISNAVGSYDMSIEVGPTLRVAARDTLLLASDGLFDNLTMKEAVDGVRCGALAAGVEALGARARRRMEAPAGAGPSKPDDCTILAWRPR